MLASRSSPNRSQFPNPRRSHRLNRSRSEPEVVEAAAPEIELSFEEPEPATQEESLEFDDTATDVSEIFISPSQEEHDTGSGSYEAVVLAVEPQPESPPATEPEPESEPEVDEPSHADTVAPGEWSLLDDDDVPADSESVIEESPLAQEPEPEVETAPEAETQVTEEIAVGDPAWVQEMFAEAEADAVRSRTAEHRTLDPMPDEDGEEPAVVARSARRSGRFGRERRHRARAAAGSARAAARVAVHHRHRCCCCSCCCCRFCISTGRTWC